MNIDAKPMGFRARLTRRERARRHQSELLFCAMGFLHYQSIFSASAPVPRYYSRQLPLHNARLHQTIAPRLIIKIPQA